MEIQMNWHRTIILLTLIPLLSACPEIEDAYDTLDLVPTTLVVSPSKAAVGQPIEVTVEGTIQLDSRSQFAELPVSDIGLGVCFVDQISSDGQQIGESGFCSIDSHTLSSKYTLLDGSTYFKEFPDDTAERGQALTYSHKFSFSLQETGEKTLSANLFFRVNSGVNPEIASGLPFSVTVE